MLKETTTQGRVGRLLRLLARFNANREELPHVEMSRVRFEAMLAQLQTIADRQSLHTALKQAATQEFQSLLVETERMATVLLVSIRQHYGIRAEKLADFGLKPFRGRKPSTEPEPEPEPSPVEDTAGSDAGS